MLRELRIAGFASRIAVQGTAAVLASLIAAYLLMALHFRQPEGTGASPDNTAISADERALTREHLKELRVQREAPAQVVVRAAPPTPESTTDVQAAIPRKLRASASPAAGAATQPPAASIPKSERATSSETASLAPGAPIILSPVVVEARAPTPGADADAVAQADVPEGAGGKVFSAISHILGAAANATGDSINFVIDLPGKVVAAGGRLVRRDPLPPSPPQPPQGTRFAAEQP